MPKFAHIRSWLPLAVLLAALASAIAMGGGDRGYLYRFHGIHDQMTAKNLAVAANLSPKHGFRLATAAWRDEDGGFEYDLYGRFPIGGYALIKFAISPFGSRVSAQTLAARALMLLMFCGAAILAYLALARIAGNRWVALSSVLLAFSSLYALYYSDSVAGETVMDLFGVALVFHGMAVFAQEGRFRQLLLKTCAALLLGWHVYGLVLPFALLGFGGEAFALVRSALSSGGGVRAALPALARSRFAALAAVSVLFGSALLAFNFANEYAAYGGSRSLRDLPSVDSMLNRLGATDSYENRSEWSPGNFLRRQSRRAGVASAPYAVAGFADYDSPPLPPPSFWWTAWGVAASVAALAAALAAPRRFRLPMASLALMGFCWALAARGNSSSELHPNEGLFYIGAPLALWSGALIGARRLLGARLGGALAIGIAALAASAFALSALHAARIRSDERDETKWTRAVMADMDAIREIAAGKSVLITSDAWRTVDQYPDSGEVAEYYLAGSYIWEGAELDLRGADAAWTRVWRYIERRLKTDSRGADADYAVIRYRDESLSLTPGNRYLFLYKSADLPELYRSERRRLESSEPDASSEFDVYLENRALRYLKSPCAPEDADARFFAHFFPPDPAYLRGEGAPIGFDGVNFEFARVVNEVAGNHGVYFDDACMMTANIPYRSIAAIHTGQYTVGGERLWDAAIFPPPSAETLALYESAYRAVADGGEPAARYRFDLHLNRLNGNKTISYLKEPCSEEDARGRFFLSVHPADVADLPAERRELGHESRNFDFVPPHGAVFNGKCMATRQLPDYDIDRIETGQNAPGGERLWDASVEVGD